MICPHCGTHIDPKAAVRFCGKCGEPLTEEQECISKAQGRSETVKECANGHFYSGALDACPYCKPVEVHALVSTDENTASRKMSKAIVFDKSDLARRAGSAKAEPKVSRQVTDSRVSEGERHPRMTKLTPSLPRKEERGGMLLGWLVTYDHDESGEDVSVRDGRRYRLGASQQCHIVIDDPAVSKHHATLIAQNGKVFLKDEFSTNGTRVNGSLVSETVELSSFDQILIGRLTFTLILASQP